MRVCAVGKKIRTCGHLHRQAVAVRKCTDAQNVCEIDFGMHRAQDFGAAVQAPHVGFHRVERGRRGREVDLVEDDAVGCGDLIDRLVVAAVQHHIVNMLADMQHINDGDDRVQTHLRREHRIDKKTRRHRGRVGHATCFHQQIVDLAAPRQQFAQHLQHIAAYIDGAADAAIDQGVNFFFGRDDQIVVDRHCAKFVFDHRDAMAVALCQDAVEQGGLAGAEKAGEDGHRQRLGGTRGSSRGVAMGRVSRHVCIQGFSIHAVFFAISLCLRNAFNTSSGVIG